MTFDFSIFAQMVSGLYPSLRCRYSLKEVLSVFRYFFSEYERHTGFQHPPISRAHAKRIIEAMPETADGVGLESDDYYDLIDAYFGTDFPDCDYRIGHFFSGEIRDRRYQEVMDAPF